MAKKKGGSGAKTSAKQEAKELKKKKQEEKANKAAKKKSGKVPFVPMKLGLELQQQLPLVLAMPHVDLGHRGGQDRNVQREIKAASSESRCLQRSNKLIHEKYIVTCDVLVRTAYRSPWQRTCHSSLWLQLA